MKKYKKKLLLISVILSLVIVILLLTFYNSGDNFKPDSDHSFYKSEYMVYSDGMITIKNPNNYLLIILGDGILIKIMYMQKG